MRNHRHTLLFTMLTVALSGTVVSAEEKAPKEVGTTRVVVAALKDDRVAEEAATSLVQVTSETMERIGATNLSNALRYEPGVTIDSSASGRIDDIKIRGVGGDRVMVAVDGAPLPKAFSFPGGYTELGQGYFDIDAMKSIDIIKGPVSMLYGSSALAGGIFMQTKDPEDFIKEGRRTGFEIKTGYNSVDRDQLITGTAAAKFTDELSAFVRASFRKHYERENYYGKAYDESQLGANRKNPNPSESNIKNILTKVVYEPNAEHKFSLSYEAYQDKTWDKGLSVITSHVMGMPSQPKYLERSSDLKTDRQQVNLRHEFESATPMFDKGHWLAYYQTTRAKQNVDELRQNFGSPARPPRPAVAPHLEDRWRASHFDNDQFGFNAEFNKDLMLGSIAHELTYGANYKHQKVKTLRLGDTINSETGLSKEPAGAFPTKSFPDSKVQEYGVFVQDRIGFLDNTIEVIVGLRYDHYSLKVKQGGAYIDGNLGTLPPTGMNKDNLSKRLAVLYYPTDNHTLYANYAEGFKAPSFTAVNMGFANLAQGYATRSNPNLKPEKSKTFELGWNYNDDINTASVAAFYTRYNDFIEEMVYQGIDKETGLMTYQSVNLDKTHIYGLEAKTSLRILELQNGDGELRFNGAVAYAKGKDDKTKEPIDSVEPLTAVLGLSYTYSDTAYVGLNWKLSKGKKDSQISEGLRKDGVKMPGYGTLDLIAEYKPTENIRVNAGIYNLLDKKHWNWGSRMGKMSNAALDRATQPGINAGISVTVNF